MSDRRTFLRGLASLPLIGGSVALIGKPTAAAVPVTDDLLFSYNEWLFYERRLLIIEQVARGYSELVLKSFVPTCGLNYHFPTEMAWNEAPQPSTRAAVVLATVGAKPKPVRFLSHKSMVKEPDLPIVKMVAR